MVADSEISILARVVDAARADLEPDVARGFLRFEFGPKDVQRMEELGRLSQEGQLTPELRAEYESYVRVGHFLALLHSKARRSLQGATAA